MGRGGSDAAEWHLASRATGDSRPTSVAIWFFFLSKLFYFCQRPNNNFFPLVGPNKIFSTPRA